MGGNKLGLIGLVTVLVVAVLLGTYFLGAEPSGSGPGDRDRQASAEQTAGGGNAGGTGGAGEGGDAATSDALRADVNAISADLAEVKEFVGYAEGNDETLAQRIEDADDDVRASVPRLASMLGMLMGGLGLIAGGLAIVMARGANKRAEKLEHDLAEFVSRGGPSTSSKGFANDPAPQAGGRTRGVGKLASPASPPPRTYAPDEPIPGSYEAQYSRDVPQPPSAADRQPPPPPPPPPEYAAPPPPPPPPQPAPPGIAVRFDEVRGLTAKASTMLAQEYRSALETIGRRVPLVIHDGELVQTDDSGDAIIQAIIGPNDGVLLAPSHGYLKNFGIAHVRIRDGSNAQLEPFFDLQQSNEGKFDYLRPATGRIEGDRVVIESRGMLSGYTA